MLFSKVLLVQMTQNANEISGHEWVNPFKWAFKPEVTKFVLPILTITKFTKNRYQENIGRNEVDQNITYISTAYKQF